MAAMMMLAGVGLQAASTIAQGEAREDAAMFQAKQQKEQANLEVAKSQREAQEVERRTELVQSELQSKSAASGFLATDETTVDLAGDIAARGELQKQDALFGGRERAAGRLNAANAAIYEGKSAKKASYIDAAGTIIGGIGNYAYKTGSFGAQKSNYRYG